MLLKLILKKCFNNATWIFQGDSGGPAVWVDPATNRYTLVGLVSFGRVCADISPTVHTDIGYYLPWIHANIAGKYSSKALITMHDYSKIMIKLST